MWWIALKEIKRLIHNQIIIIIDIWLGRNCLWHEHTIQTITFKTNMSYYKKSTWSCQSGSWLQKSPESQFQAIWSWYYIFNMIIIECISFYLFHCIHLFLYILFCFKLLNYCWNSLENRQNSKVNSAVIIATLAYTKVY